MANGSRLEETIKHAGAIAAALIVVARFLSFAWHRARDRSNKRLHHRIIDLENRLSILESQPPPCSRDPD